MPSSPSCSPSNSRPGDPWKDVTAVVVVYNSAAVVGQCLRSLSRAARVIVVDNNSTDDTRDQARAALPTVEIIENPSNMGYGTANNIGFERSATPYTLLLNPDAMIVEGAMERLVAALEAYASAAVAAPILLSPGGELELYVMGFGEKRHHRLEAPPDGDMSTGFIMGAAMLWRMEAWRRLGGFDEAIFIYGEDTDLALRTTAAGYSMVVVPEAVVRHLGGRSDPPSREARWRKDWHMTWGGLYVMAKYGEERQARDKARRLLRRHGLKTLFYVLVLRPRRFLGNLARAHAAWTFLRRQPSWPGRRLHTKER